MTSQHHKKLQCFKYEPNDEGPMNSDWKIAPNCKIIGFSKIKIESLWWRKTFCHIYIFVHHDMIIKTVVHKMYIFM